MSVINITKENFKQEVAEYKGTVLLDFWATCADHAVCFLQS